LAPVTTKFQTLSLALHNNQLSGSNYTKYFGETVFHAQFSEHHMAEIIGESYIWWICYFKRLADFSLAEPQSGNNR